MDRTSFPIRNHPKSAHPPFSRGVRDDLMQARGLEAILSRFDPALSGFQPAYNPVSAVDGRRMIDPANMFVWAWDARPFPVFPDFTSVWADGGNWETGHWITGRIEGAALDRLIVAILRDFGVPNAGPLPVDGFVDGYVVDRPMSARGAMEPLMRMFGIDAVASGGATRWRGRGGRAVIPIAKDDLVMDDKSPALKLTRSQETELPQQVEIGFTDSETDYRRATVASRRLSGSSRREARADSPLITRRAEAQRLADAWLQDLWAAREGAEFELSHRCIDLEPGDVVSLPTDAGEKLHRIVRIADGPTRKITSRAIEPTVFETPGLSVERPVKRPPPIAGKPLVVVLDLPASVSDPTPLQYAAVAADPWPSAVTIWRSSNGASYSAHRIVDLPAIIGTTMSELEPGPLWRFDPKVVLDVEISSGTIAAIDDEAALAGGNLFALRGLDGRWEILSAARAELVGDRRYRLSRLLRGLSGSEPEAARTVPVGAQIVRLDEAIVPLTSDLRDLGQTWRYRVGPALLDHGDPAFVEFTATVGRDALRPFSPVHLTAKRLPGGVSISWLRRSRLDGDAWEPLDIPLGETTERYELDIMNGETVLRTLSSNAPALIYPDAFELADFGAEQRNLRLRVVQMSGIAAAASRPSRQSSFDKSQRRTRFAPATCRPAARLQHKDFPCRQRRIWRCRCSPQRRRRNTSRITRRWLLSMPSCISPSRSAIETIRPPLQRKATAISWEVPASARLPATMTKLPCSISGSGGS